MNVWRTLGVVILLCFGWSCGVQPVELRPGERAAGVDEQVIGQVPAAAIATLQAQRATQGEETLRLIYPAEELVVPADLAPIGFEWRAGKKAGAMQMAAEMPAPGDMAAMTPMAPMAMAMEMGMGKGMGQAPQPPAAGPGMAGQAAPPPQMMEGMAGPKNEKPGKERIVAYELHVHGASAGMRVYTAAERAALPRAGWSQLLHAHSGHTLTVELRGVRQDGAIVHAAPLRISVRGEMPAGLFYSFSSSSPGLTRARLSATHDTRVLPPLGSEQGSGCVGCHAISRDGKRMLLATAAPAQLFSWPLPLSLPSSEQALRLIWPSQPADSSTPDYIQGAFDSAAARVAATQSGRLLLFDADSGEPLAPSAAPLSAAVAAPDWSPDGRNIVLEVSEMGGADAARSSIATVQVGLDGKLSELKVLIEGAPDEQLRAPRYSLDGEWIVYEKRMGPMHDARDSKLFIVRATADQRGEPIELRKLAQGAGPMADARAPAFALGDEPGHAYLLFSSRRAVGSFVPAEGQRQLFAAELDLSLAAAGEDPSHAPFWLPFQQRGNSYLQVQWAPALRACTPSAELCDDGDDDCDGEIDEDCCTPAAESCGDSSDNDCDGAVDEGCGCAFVETCGNQRDDDCDLRTDEKPCMPAPAMKEP